MKILEEKFGEILLESSPSYWNYSDYYTPELGSPIWRRFIFFRNLISEGDIAQIKIQTNEIEQALSNNGK
ncbi:MAG: DUF4416 family protein, partial [Thermodesulfovibrio sp.]|nr:DUF4416 family protein [Thermodesulfovibrio sp.]